MGSALVNKYTNVQIYPNPATDYYSIQNAKGALLEINNFVGRELYHKIVLSDNEPIPINNLSSGIYMVNIIDPETGEKISKKLAKE